MRGERSTPSSVADCMTACSELRAHEPPAAAFPRACVLRFSHTHVETFLCRLDIELYFPRFCRAARYHATRIDLRRNKVKFAAQHAASSPRRRPRRRAARRNKYTATPAPYVTTGSTERVRAQHVRSRQRSLLDHHQDGTPDSQHDRINTNRHGRRQLHQARSRLANEMCPGDTSRRRHCPNVTSRHSTLPVPRPLPSARR